MKRGRESHTMHKNSRQKKFERHQVENTKEHLPQNWTTVVSDLPLRSVLVSCARSCDAGTLYELFSPNQESTFWFYELLFYSDEMSRASGSGFFLVDPVLKSGEYDEKIPLDCVTCQTVLAKSLGPFNEWKARLQVSRKYLQKWPSSSHICRIVQCQQRKNIPAKVWRANEAEKE